MALRQFSLTDFRNLKSTTLDFNPRFNLITGCNAAGKTNLLESIYMLCQGQSFRHRRNEVCIQSGKEFFLIFGRFDNDKIGISRSDQKTSIRINGENAHKLSQLTSITPIRVVYSESFKYVVGQPKDKRAFIDWLLFHVEHDFKDIWNQYRHGLKQRNALLRSKMGLDQLTHWNEFVASQGELIYELRKTYCQKLEEKVNDDFVFLTDNQTIQIEYCPGWKDEKYPLLEALNGSNDKDIQRGFTSVGIHRDDIRIRANEIDVSDVFSRGQLKRLSIALVLAQLSILRQRTDKSTILLIDDLEAELDQVSIKKVLKLIKALEVQAFVSNIGSLSSYTPLLQQYHMFHVEHGIIRPVK